MPTRDEFFNNFDIARKESTKLMKHQLNKLNILLLVNEFRKLATLAYIDKAVHFLSAYITWFS